MGSNYDDGPQCYTQNSSGNTVQIYGQGPAITTTTTITQTTTTGGGDFCSQNPVACQFEGEVGGADEPLWVPSTCPPNCVYPEWYDPNANGGVCRSDYCLGLDTLPKIDWTVLNGKAFLLEDYWNGFEWLLGTFGAPSPELTGGTVGYDALLSQAAASTGQPMLYLASLQVPGVAMVGTVGVGTVKVLADPQVAPINKLLTGVTVVVVVRTVLVRGGFGGGGGIGSTNR
jgi:hypothetical protein